MEMLLNYNELNKNRVYDTLDLCNGIHFNAIGQGDRVRICRYIFDSEDKMAARIVIISGRVEQASPAAPGCWLKNHRTIVRFIFTVTISISTYVRDILPPGWRAAGNRMKS